ncbi:hypothetical protein VTL71DRAFT_4439 [Oculimacula yallundae]|uniref:Protein kinase domain-containing protein n=1 Tax=Oculimacula yallundae TaxID=86028 RepID=A0ABR4C205_9HELO
MFNSQDSNGKGWSTRAQSAEVIGSLGPPPLDFLERGLRSKEFFDADGKWIADVPIPDGQSLELWETRLEGENKDMFIQMMKSMLTWKPEDRKTAKQMLDEPWLKDANYRMPWERGSVAITRIAVLYNLSGWYGNVKFSSSFC